MTTLNTKKVDDNAYEYDPFSEYHHPQEVLQQEQEHVIQPITEMAIQDGKAKLLKNIDDMFDGADFVFDIANRFFQRLGGKKC